MTGVFNHATESSPFPDKVHDPLGSQTRVIPGAKEASAPNVHSPERVALSIPERADLDQPIDERNVDFGVLGEFFA